MVTNINVIRSGGVIIAATNMIMTNECLRYLANVLEVTIPILPRKNAITGNWNTTPITIVSETNVEIYESSVMLLTTRSETLYVPRKRNDIGNRTKYDIMTPRMNNT